MKRCIVGVVIGLVSAGICGSSPVELRSFQKGNVGPYEFTARSEDFVGGQRAAIIAIGNGRTHLGLYVFDSLGNCVALDDMGNSRTRDDLALEWFPEQAGAYTYEVRNFGPFTNTYEIMVK
jgi:hypothetical protein